MALRGNQFSLDGGPNPESGRPDNPLSGLEASAPDPVDEASRAERKLLVEEALARLDADQRMVIVLRDLEGRDYAEIAELLDCPRGTVKSRLHRARLALKDLLVIRAFDEVGRLAGVVGQVEELLP